MLKYVNLTPHDVVLYKDQRTVTIPPSGKVAQLRLHESRVDVLKDGTEIAVVMLHPRIENLPDPRKDTYYIVSMPVAQFACRPDVVCPDTSPGSRVCDTKGRIIGVKRLRRFVQFQKGGD